MKTLPLALAAVLFALPAQATLNLSNRPTKNMDCSGGVCMATAANAVLNVDDLASMLATSDIEVVTDGLFAQDIEVTAPVTWMGSHALSLESNDAILVRRPIVVAGAAHLTFAVAGGPVFEQKGQVRFLDMAGALTIDGDGYVLVNSIAGLKAAVAANPEGFIAFADDYDAGPDGLYTHTPVDKLFDGTFEGLGNTISNFSLADLVSTSVALFTQTKRHAVLRNFGLANAHIEGNYTIGENVIGALIGFNYGRIIDCHASGDVTADIDGYAGGLVGYNLNSVYRSWADVRVSVKQTGYAGGLIGRADKGQVFDSYALGDATTGRSSQVGGLIGGNLGHVRSGYATGQVSGDVFSYVGGAFGATSFSSKKKNRNVYWDTDTGGTANGVGNGNATGVTGLTTVQLQSALPDGFSPSIWGRDPRINGGLPYLLTNPPR